MYNITSLGLTYTVLTTTGLSVFLLIAFFVWQYLNYTRPYRQFPCINYEGKLLMMLLSGNYRKDVPYSTVVFQDMIKGARRYLDEGLFIMTIFRRYLLIYNEEFSKALYSETAVANKPFVYALDEYIAEGLVGSEENVWKVHRKILNPAFSYSELNNKIPYFNDNAKELVKTFHSVSGKPITDLVSILRICTFNTLAESVLGLNLKDESYREKADIYMESFNIIKELYVKRAFSPWLYIRSTLPLFSDGRKYLLHRTKLEKILDEIIDELKETASSSKNGIILNNNKNSDGRKPLMEIIYEQHLKGNFSYSEVRSHINTFMMAGYETVFFSLFYCFYCIGRHPEVQEKLKEEIDAVVKNEDVTSQELNELKYMDCVIKESLRLYSTAPVYIRKLSKQIQLGKYTIPKDTEIIFFAYMLHRNPQIYSDPEKFDPDRFDDNSNIRPWMYIPFAEGYRNCIGKKFALMEMKVVLVHCLRKFKITSLTKIEDRDLDFCVTMRTTKPVHFLISPRDA